MALLDILLGGLLAAGGGALVAWMNSSSSRKERLASRRDMLNREAVEAATLAELVVGQIDPASLTLFVGPLEEGTRDEEALALVDQANSAQAALTRVAVGHDDDSVASMAREARALLVQAANRSLRLRASVRSDHSHDRVDFTRAEEKQEEAMAAVRSLQEAIRASMDR